MIDSVKGGTEVQKGQASHVSDISCLYHVRQKCLGRLTDVKWNDGSGMQVSQEIMFQLVIDGH